jgi:hypothetical protein
LPTFVPPYADRDNPVYAIVESVGPDIYRIQFAWAVKCEGGNWCHLGEITGSRGSVKVTGSMTPVVLPLGITGYFVGASVGAYCSDAMVSWNERGYHYSVAMKCERKTTLLKMAGSAIISARRTRP